jgi:NAD(P)-dependent dehydrogenase (short-subunit alcohol dehydrogenase family)
MHITGDMTGKVALITGATGGLGKAVARNLSEAGARVFLVDSDGAHLEAVLAALRAAGFEAVSHVSDLVGATRCKATVAAAINPSNASDMAEADWERTLAVNLSAPFYLFQAALPHLIHQPPRFAAEARIG